jgi:hypothetical protein
MPLEGHWERINTPVRKLSRRETRILAAVSAALVCAVLLIGFAALRADSTPAGPGCIDMTLATSTGGAQIHACGPDAVRLCRAAARERSVGAQVRERCRSAGYL